MFKPGSKYKRSEVFDLLGIPESKRNGDWMTGYHRHIDSWFIFTNVGTAGRTGPDYPNEWVGEDLRWYGKTGSHVGQPQIDNLLSATVRVHVFWRSFDRAPFEYAGVAFPKEIDTNSTPVSVLWSFGEPESSSWVNADEVQGDQTYPEGAVSKVLVNAYERNPEARKKCIEHFGHICVVCEFDFAAKYGSMGADYIHVHHLKALSDIGGHYEVDPINDLRPVCPNCHAMLHRRKSVVSIDELRQVVDRIRAEKRAAASDLAHSDSVDST